MKKISLYGAGGHCYAAVELIRSLGSYDPEVIYDDNPNATSILGVPVQPTPSEPRAGDWCISIGNNEHRAQAGKRVIGDFPHFVHNSAVVYPSVKIGKGTLVHPNAVLDADCSVGSLCIVNNNATISHNCRIDDYCHVAIQAALAGGVTVGEGALLGAGCVVLPNIKIGKWATVAAGAVVTRDVPDYAVVAGTPAQIIKYRTHE